MKFYHYAIKKNVWLWFHLLGGAVLAALAHVWLNEPHSLLVVFSAALAWEVVEWGGMTILNDKHPYGDEYVSPGQHFFMDAVGDVLGAMIIAALVLVN